MSLMRKHEKHLIQCLVHSMLSVLALVVVLTPLSTTPTANTPEDRKLRCLYFISNLYFGWLASVGTWLPYVIDVKH